MKGIGAFIALLLKISCDAGHVPQGELAFSQKVPSSRYTLEEAFAVLREKYELEQARYKCIVAEERYFFPVDQKTFPWRKLGYWVDPFAGECGKYTDPMKYVDDGVYQRISFESQEDGYRYTYKDPPQMYLLGAGLQLRQRFLGF